MIADWLPSTQAVGAYHCQNEGEQWLYDCWAAELRRKAILENGTPVLELNCKLSLEMENLVSCITAFHQLALEMKLEPKSVYGKGRLDTSIRKPYPDNFTFRDFTEERACYMNAHSALWLERHSTCVTFQIVTQDEQLLQRFEELRDQFGAETSKSNEIYMLMQNSNGLSARSLSAKFEPLQQGNYTEPIIKDFDKIQAILRADHPSGRLIILDGPPGTGKSYLVRGMIQALQVDEDPEDPEFRILFIPSHIVASLTGPALLPTLIQFSGNKIILVIEDADMALVQREGTNNAEVSTMLNLTDGIIGDILDLRIVCTTNQKLDDIDGAIKRRGRLACHSHLGNLPADLAKRVYTRLTGNPAPEKTLDRVTSLADVYALAKDGGWTPEVGGKVFSGFVAPIGNGGFD